MNKSVMYDVICAEKCNQDFEEPSKYVVCYLKEAATAEVDVCRCSHLVVPVTFQTAVNFSVDQSNFFLSFSSFLNPLC